MKVFESCRLLFADLLLTLFCTVASLNILSINVFDAETKFVDTEILRQHWI